MNETRPLPHGPSAPHPAEPQDDVPDDVPDDVTPGPAPRGGPRRGSVGVWVVLGALLAGWTVFQGAGWTAALIGRDSDTVTQRLEARDRLVVDVPSGQVRVTADDSATAATVDLTAHRSWAFSTPEIVSHADDDTLTIEIDCHFVLVGWCTADLDLRVPADTDVQVTSDSGDLEVSGIAGTAVLQSDSGSVGARSTHGDVRLQTDSGDVEASDVTGDLSLDTDSGSIRVLSSAASRVEARTDSGDVRLDLTADPTEVRSSTDSGSVEILVPDSTGVAYRLDLASGSGRTDGAVRTDPSSTRRISAETDSGNVTVAYR